METDPQDLVDQAVEAAARSTRLNATVAVTVAVLATFMGICKVKDDNIVQAMQQAQADKIDHWSYYQARNLRQEVAETTVTQLELARPAAASASQAASYDQAIVRYRQLAADQAQKKEQLRGQAEEDQRHYDALNYRDDQFDLCDALLAIAIAMLAVTALTQMWPLYFLALVPMGFGVMMGLAGLGGWALHPEALVKLLS
jgi:ribosomal protein S13